MLRTTSLLLAWANGGTAMAQPEPIVPAGMEGTVENFHYSPAVRAGDWVYLSGIVAGVPGYDVESGDLPAPETLAPAFRNAFGHAATVLEASGADWGDVVEITTFHTDLPGQIAAFAAVKDEFISAKTYPAWTAIDIDRLYPDSGIVEIKLVAYAP